MLHATLKPSKLIQLFFIIPDFELQRISVPIPTTEKYRSGDSCE